MIDAQTLLDAQPWGTIVLDARGEIVTANARARALFARPLPCGTLFADVLAECTAPAFGSTGDEAAQQAKAAPASLERGIELPLNHATLWLKGEPLPGGGCVVGVAEVTPLVHSLDERTGSLRFLVHDLRSPLNSIAALVQLRDSDSEAFEHCGGMQQIGELARYALALGEQFIVSSLATHLEQRDFRRFDLRAMVRQMIPQLEVTAVYCGVLLQLWLPEGPAAWVSGVRNFVARALQNVVDNAIHASREGEPVTVSLKIREGFVDIVVSDRAGGLPGLREAATVTDFDALARAGAAGFGIGIKLARQIVELHGGALRAESTPGEGTSFVLTLPRLGAAPGRGAAVSFVEAEQAHLRRVAD